MLVGDDAVHSSAGDEVMRAAEAMSVLNVGYDALSPRV